MRHRGRRRRSADATTSEARHVTETLGADGGYMLAAVHSVEGDVPPGYVLAMVAAVEEFGRYLPGG